MQTCLTSGSTGVSYWLKGVGAELHVQQQVVHGQGHRGQKLAGETGQAVSGEEQ
jgi:hypothetical protein